MDNIFDVDLSPELKLEIAQASRQGQPQGNL
jgi:hypothetical protein